MKHFGSAMWQTMWAILWTTSQGRARTQSPTTRNYAVEIPTFGEFIRVSTAGVQWLSLAKGEPPSWSRCLPCQVSMSCKWWAWVSDSSQHPPQFWWHIMKYIYIIESSTDVIEKPKPVVFSEISINVCLIWAFMYCFCNFPACIVAVNHGQSGSSPRYISVNNAISLNERLGWC